MSIFTIAFRKTSGVFLSIFRKIPCVRDSCLPHTYIPSSYYQTKLKFLYFFPENKKSGILFFRIPSCFLPHVKLRL